MSYNLKQEWEKTKNLVHQGYKILDKQVILNIPAPCLPPDDCTQDTGIGSPVSQGGKRFLAFFDGLFDKVLLGPFGRTFAPFYSPYESTYGQNPFFIDLKALTTEEYGKLLTQKTLNEIYKKPKKDGEIFFPNVNRGYNLALSEAFKVYKIRLAEKNKFALLLSKKIQNLSKTFSQSDALFYAPFSPDRYLFEEALTELMLQKIPYPLIADLEVKLPDSLTMTKPEMFLKDFTLGAPPDIFSTSPQNWCFKVLNPDFIFNKDGSLGEGGLFLFNTFDKLFQTYKGGIRIDHYIGWVNPFVIAQKPTDKSGRLYSSPENPKLSKFTKKTPEEFAELTEKIIIAAMKKNKRTTNDIFPEDLGARPHQLDAVMQRFHLGRMLVSQFMDLQNPKSIYRLKNANAEDIAVLDTHDTPSIRDFFENLDFEKRQVHARLLSEDLRFFYTDALTDPKMLFKMKWAELLSSPAHRVQAFFTSFTGQNGRYNDPSNPKKWQLRCVFNFEKLYFQNLIQGTAYNPIDAIAWAIYAKGDDFYAQNKDFITDLKKQGDLLFTAIKDNFS